MMMRRSRPIGKRKSRAFSVAAALVVGALVLTLGFTVAGVSFHHLNVSTRLSNAQVAEDLAESALATTIERIQEREAAAGKLDFGANGAETITIHTEGAPENAFGLVSFDAKDLESRDFQLTPSVNNLTSDSAMSSANGRQIPAEAVYLVGYGVCNGVERRVEAMVHVPRFPYSVASQGSIRGTNLLVAALRDGAELPPNGIPDPNDLMPGHLVTNSDVGSTAISFSGTNTVKGDLQSASGVDLSHSETTVDGETRTFAGTVELPDVDIASYRPDPSDSGTNTSLSSVENALHLDGQTLYSNPSTPLIITNGLTLDGGVLFVEGDLKISGGLSGKGAVVATGSIDVRGTGRLSTDNLTALVAGGDISIDGGAGSADAARYEGLIYTEGNLKAQNLTLVGVFVANNDGTEQADLRNVKIYEKGEHSKIGFETTTMTTKSSSASASPGYGGLLGAPRRALGLAKGEGNHEFRLFAKIKTAINEVGHLQEFTSVDQLIMVIETARGQPLSDPQKDDWAKWAANMNSEGKPDTSDGRYVLDGEYTMTIAEVDETGETVSDSDGGESTKTETTGETLSQSIFSLDLSDFLSLADRMKILYWGLQ